MISQLHLDAAEVCSKMADIHYNIALLKSKVSLRSFLQIVSSVGLPLTTISIVDPGNQGVNVDSLHVCDHMPDPSRLHGNEATQLLGTVKPRTKKQNPVDKGQTGLTLQASVCKYCGKVCYSEETLSIHINNKHADRQSVFQCTFCGRKFNDFKLYVHHLQQHSKDMYRC